MPNNSVLLVESLDRISRLSARRALRVLEDIAAAGVTVVTLNDGRKYTLKQMDEDPVSLLVAILTFIRSNEESATKAARLSRAWEAKRSKAAEKPLTARCPAWLTMRQDRSGFDAIPERAEVVREVYRMSAEGLGQNAIAAELNRRGLPTWGDSGRRPAKYWQRSYIAKLLNSPSVIGTLVPRVRQRVNGRKTSKPLEPLVGYYPAVVDPEVFASAQTRRGRRTGRGSNGANGTHLKHLLAGLARCPLCAGTMTRVEKGRKGGRPYLVCSRAKVGAGCEYKSVPISNVEAAMLRDLHGLFGEVPTSIHLDETSEEAHRLSQESAGLGFQIEAAVAALLENRESAALRRHLADLEAKQAEVERRYEQLAAEFVQMDPRYVRVRLTAAADALSKVASSSTAECMTAANARLHELLSGVTVDHRSHELRFDFKHGASLVLPVPEMLAPAPRRAALRTQPK